MKTLLDGGAAPVAVRDWDESWVQDGWLLLDKGDLIVRMQGDNAYIRVSANAGAPSAPVKFDASEFKGEPRFLAALPGDRGVLLSAVSYEGGGWGSKVGVLDLRRGRASLLLRDAAFPTYVPTGHLLFQRGAMLQAVPLDPIALETRGGPVALLDGLYAAGLPWSSYSISRDGTRCHAVAG